MPGKSSGLKPPSKIARPSGAPPKTSPSSGKLSARNRILLLWAHTDAPVQENTAKHVVYGRRSTLGCETAIVLITGAPKPVPPDDPPGSVTSPTQEGGGNFQVGDKVWVNGSKPGYVRFIGGTQFAPGQWAGIVLDEPIGKNDGSVAGVRYFQCEDGRGIFTRPSKLSKTALPEKDTNGTPAGPPPAAPAEPPPAAAPTGNARARRRGFQRRRALSEWKMDVSDKFRSGQRHKDDRGTQPKIHRVGLKPLRP